jgi:hypothetical protein
MTIGVGGSSFEAELAKLKPMTDGIEPIAVTEFKARIAKAQALLREQGLQALYLDTSTSLAYFTGIQLTLSERLHGAVIPAEGEIVYLSPTFEEPKTRELMRFGEEVRCWEEHEDPTELVIETIRSLGYESGQVALDPHTPFYIVDGLRKAGNRFSFSHGNVDHRGLPAAEVGSRDRLDPARHGHHHGGPSSGGPGAAGRRHHGSGQAVPRPGASQARHELDQRRRPVRRGDGLSPWRAL